MMSWIGVRPRVFGGFGLVLSFLVVLGGFAMVQVERIGGTVNELVTSAAGDAGMSQVRAALLSANGAVEKFIRTWNVGDKDAATQAIAGWRPTGLRLRQRRRPSTGCVPPRRKLTPMAPSRRLMSAASRSPSPTDPIRNGSSTRCGSPPWSTRCGSP